MKQLIKLLTISIIGSIIALICHDYFKSNPEKKTVEYVGKVVDNNNPALCEEEIKKNAAVPNSVEMHWFVDQVWIARENGNVVLSTSYSADNVFGARMKIKVYCVFDHKGKFLSYWSD